MPSQERDEIRKLCKKWLDSGGKDERAGKGEGQRTVVDLLFSLVIGSEKSQQEQNCDPSPRNC